MFSFCRASRSSSSSSAVDYSLWRPSSSSKSSNPVHAASLVDPLAHSSELLQLLHISLWPSVIEYLVDCISEVVDDALATAGVKSFPSSRSRFATFVSKVLSRAEVTPPTVLVALAYLDRAAPYLCIGRAEWADERVFLGALICASKYTNDSSLRNVHWAVCTGVFGKRDIGRIEREFLDVLDWRLRVTEQDLLAHRRGLMRAAGMRAAVPGPNAVPLQRSVRRLPQRPQHQRTYSSSSTSSIGSLPSLSPTSSPDSFFLSPTPSPRTPPPHLPDVPMDVDLDLEIDADMYDVPPIAKLKNGRFAVQMRSLPRVLPIQRRPLPHPYSNPQSQSQAYSYSRGRRLV